MEAIFIEGFYPQTKGEVCKAVKELIGRCPAGMPETDIEFAITEAIEETLLT